MKLILFAITIFTVGFMFDCSSNCDDLINCNMAMELERGLMLSLI